MEPAKNDTSPRDDKAEEAQGLGISRGIYALGHSVKDALIWGTAATAASILVLTVGKDKSRAIKSVADTIDKWHKSYKNAIGKRFEGPVIAVSLVVGWIVSHVAQIPGGVFGWKKAQQAHDKFDALSDQRDELVDANLLLREENVKLQAALAAIKEKSVPYAQTVRSRDGEMAAVAGRG